MLSSASSGFFRCSSPSGLPLSLSLLHLFYMFYSLRVLTALTVHGTHTHTHTVAIGQRLRHNAPKLYSTCWQAREVSSRTEERRRGSGKEEGGWVVACNSNSCSMDWQNLLALLSCLQAKADYLLAIGISLSICLPACLVMQMPRTCSACLLFFPLSPSPSISF